MPERTPLRSAIPALLAILMLVSTAQSDQCAFQHQGDKDPRSLYLRTGQVDLRQRSSVLSDPDQARFGAAHYVIQLDGPMTPQRRNALEAAGVNLGEYLPMYAYITDLDQARPDELVKLDFVSWVGEFDPSWAVCPSVGAHTFTTAERRHLEARGVKRLVVRLFDESDIGLVAEKLDLCGARICDVEERKGECQIEIDISADGLDELRDFEQIMFVEEAAEGQPRNASTSWITQTNTADTTRLWDMGLLGQNQVAGIIDWNLSTTHCAFADAVNPIGPNHRKILAFYGDGSGGNARHGTHVGGVLAGNDPAETDPAFRGQAPECKIVFSNQPSEITATNLYSQLEIHHNDGARVHNNSWGNSDRNYIAWSRDIDDFTRDFEDDLVLVAVTNPNIQVQAPENSKNVLAVAATEDTPNQGNRCFGGFGPTLDGRQKPEVWAPGCDSRSASATLQCGVDTWAGTSFAAPAVGAMGILARQYFMEGYYPDGAADETDAFTPSGALLKAVIINSAVDMTGISDYFSVNEGWGRVLMDDALFFSGDERKLIVEDIRNANGLSTEETNSYSINVNSSLEPLKITLVWNDVPASLMAAFTPVNNLDLVVTDPNNVTYFGNVFSGLQSATGGAADTVNNTEQVHRTTPENGTWTIEVVGTAVNQSTQGYALVITGDVSPAGDDEDDCNNNDVPDEQDITNGTSQDCNFNGIPDECDIDPSDPDGDGEFSFDCNNNQVPDECDLIGVLITADCNSNGVTDECEIAIGVLSDCNSNGIPDVCDIDPGDPDDNGEVSPDCNNNNIIDECDIDLSDPDGDGEVYPDCNNDEVPDVCELSGDPRLDCNNNGVPDECDIADGTSLDCNDNEVPDECDTDPTDPDGDGEISPDCDNDDVPDECELSGNLILDCNDNGELDNCDIADGTSLDCNSNGIPDECDVDTTDPDGNDLISSDCNNNGIPDECDLSEGIEPDCNGNGVPDGCDLTDGTSADCNDNGIPDFCDIAGAASLDCNGNGIPDECDLSNASSPDCNNNLVPDECDIANGTSPDADGNGIPDECDPTPENPPQEVPEDDDHVVDRDGLRSLLGFFFNMPNGDGQTVSSIPANIFGIFGLQLSFTLMFLEWMDLPVRSILFELFYAFWDAILP